MDRIALKADEREILGKKVKKLRREGLVPAHVFGKGLETEHVSVDAKDFIKVLAQAGETGLIDLRIGAEKVRPVLIRELQYHALTGKLLHIDFYQVNLSVKVTVPVPIILIGDEPESVHLGETVVLQTLNEVSVEALPADLIENLEVSISTLKEIGDVITVSQLSYDHSKITVLAEPEEVVVKLDTAVTEEMKKLLEEQEAEASAAQEAAVAEEGGEAKEGEEGETAEGTESTEGGETAGEAAPESSDDEPSKE